MRSPALALALVTAACSAAQAAAPDWLLDPSPYRASVRREGNSLVMENGLVRRSILLAPNAATVDYQNLTTGEQLLRAAGPEAKVTLNGTAYHIGGLEGQPVQNYLKADWLQQLRANPAAYRFADWKEEPVTARFPWKKRPEWLSRDLPWPAPGKHVRLRFIPPATAAPLAGPVLVDEPFRGPLDRAWKTTASPKHPRSSFANEGKAGEIAALPDTCVFAERPWPQGAVSAEVTLDTGDDTMSNAWGPGLALVTKAGPVALVARPNQQVFECNGEVTNEKFDRAKPLSMRVIVLDGTARFETCQNGQPYRLIGTVPCPQPPLALRVGKVGRNGAGADYPEAAGEQTVRCHITRVTMRGPDPQAAKPAAGRPDLPEVDVHYTIYDGIPLIEKWLVIRNTTGRAVRVDKTVVETLNTVETEGTPEPNINLELPSLHVETDYAFLAMNAKGANKQTVRWLRDPSYTTQVSYPLESPVLLEVAPEFGPATDLAGGASLVSIRAFELFRDSTERERRGLAQRRMYRVIAPWSQENPVLGHLISSDPATIRKIIDQAAEVGFEMIILSFGSGMNMENKDPSYQAKYKEVADYARSKGIVIGAYSLLASRGAGTPADNCRGPGNRIRYGVMPCLGSKWGQDYLDQVRDFLTNTGFAILEHDGSYPGDTCAAADHPGHRGLDDSQWVQHQAIANLYQWCRANGVYLNVPDWYFLNGSNKVAMGYRETNWSLPRAEQEIIERQNIYDGTWEKTPSMGWMMVPLTQYHGGGAAATIEPLKDHLPHYEARLANLFGAGVQACWRGPRIYDTDETKALVKRWVDFYKTHRQVLDSDIIHLRRPDGRDWDGILHVNPQGAEKGLLMLHNPLAQAVTRTLKIPLYYTGLTESATVAEQNGQPKTIPLDRDFSIPLPVTIPAHGRTWFTFR